MAIPVVVCGVSSVMGGRVAPRLRPEFEVIQFITSVERAKSEISTLLAGKTPQPDPDNVGSHNFSKKPEAVIFGRGFDSPTVQDIFQACGGPSSGLVWLRSSDEGVANVKAKPPTPDELDGYADNIAQVVKEVLHKVKTNGDWGKAVVHAYDG